MEAAYRAIATITFVAPEAVVTRVIERLNVDLKADDIEALTEEDFGIWSTPEGTAFIDGTVAYGGYFMHILFIRLFYYSSCWKEATRAREERKRS